MRKVGPRIHTTVTTEALVFNRRTKSYLTFYNTCCGVAGSPLFSPSQFSGSLGPLGDFLVQGTDYCSGQLVDLTVSSTFSSDNTGIATVTAGGSVTGVGAGSTFSNGNITYFQQKTVDTCITKTAHAPKPTAVCTFSILPGAVTQPCNGSRRSTVFQAQVPLGTCNLDPNSPQTSGRITATGNIDIDVSASFFMINSVGVPEIHVSYFAGPPLQNGTAGTLNPTFSLKFFLIDAPVVKSIAAIVRCG